MTRLLREAERGIAEQLADSPTDYQAWQLPRLQASVREAMEAFGASAGQGAAEAMGRAWDAGAAAVAPPSTPRSAWICRISGSRTGCRRSTGGSCSRCGNS